MGDRESCFSCCTQCHFFVRIASRKSLRALCPGELERGGVDRQMHSKVLPYRNPHKGPAVQGPNSEWDVHEAKIVTAIKVISAINVPGMDINGGSDPFVRITLQNTDGTALSQSRSWPHRTNTLEPVWHTTRLLEGAFVEGTQLFVELLDFDDAVTTSLRGEDIIGSTTIGWSEAIARGQEMEVELEYSSRVKPMPDKLCTLRLRVMRPPESTPTADSQPSTSSPFVRWVFLIRHGESAWNKAKTTHAFHTMLDRNHPLSDEGVNQAERLASLIMAVVHGERDVEKLAGEHGVESVREAAKRNAPPTSEAYEALAGIGVVYASPLTRATQTALITLQHHPHLANHGIVLRSNLREVKNWFGLDTTGTSRGERIAHHVEKSTKDVVGPLRRAWSERVCSPKVDHGDATDIWWNDIKEFQTDVRNRMDEVLTMLKFDLCGYGGASPANAVLVGHSLFFRNLVGKNLSKEFEDSRPEFAKLLKKEKLPNCGVIALKMDFHKPVDQCIVDAQLLFDTRMGDTYLVLCLVRVCCMLT